MNNQPAPGSCRTCGAALKWVRMESSGKSLPVNPIPDPSGGNVAARWTGARWAAGYVLRKGEDPKPGFSVFRPHAADCRPDVPRKTRAESAAAFLF